MVKHTQKSYDVYAIKFLKVCLTVCLIRVFSISSKNVRKISKFILNIPKPVLQRISFTTLMFAYLLVSTFGRTENKNSCISFIDAIGVFDQY